MIFNGKNIFALRRRNEASGKVTDIDLRIATTQVPVAYLFNGVQLPPLPDHDAEAYPHAIIFNKDGVLPKLFFSTLPMYVTAEGNVTPPAGGTAYGYLKSYEGNGIVGITYIWVKLAYTIGEGSTEFTKSDLLWSDYDVLGEDGKVHLAASEPVPVYE